MAHVNVGLNRAGPEECAEVGACQCSLFLGEGAAVVLTEVVVVDNDGEGLLPSITITCELSPGDREGAIQEIKRSHRQNL